MPWPLRSNWRLPRKAIIDPCRACISPLTAYLIDLAFCWLIPGTVACCAMFSEAKRSLFMGSIVARTTPFRQQSFKAWRGRLADWPV